MDTKNMGETPLNFPINAKIIRDDYGNKLYELIDLGGRVWIFDYTTGVSKSLQELDLEQFLFDSKSVNI